MAFHNVSFPLNFAVGLSATTTWATEIVTTRSGNEDRNSPMSHARRRYEARVPPDLHTARSALLDFWHGRRGPLYSFRLEDPDDHKSSGVGAAPANTDQSIGTGDAATVAFQLVKVYDSAGSAPFTRDITKPQSGTVLIALDGVDQTEGGGSDFTVDYSTGIVTFNSAPGSSVAITAGFRFDVPVRFEDDELPVQFLMEDPDDLGTSIVEYPTINMIEVRGE